jgi:hypothetical protein
MGQIFNPIIAGGSGSGTGTGAKNYLSVYTASSASGVANTGNGDLELGSTTGWSKGNVALTSNFPSGSPTFGSGSSANLSISTVTSGSQIAGTYSLSYASSAATVAGDFVASDAFYIDAEDQAKVLTVKFYYKAQTNPANANWSGTSSNSFGVALYDVTTGGSSGWIMPAGVWGMTQSSGVGYCTATFQTTSSSTQYRLVVFNANATSGAVTLYFDDFVVGPQTAPLGSAVTDPIAYTPTITGFGTPSSVSFVSWRNGAYLFAEGTFTAGTNTATEAQITLGYQGGNANVTSLSTLPTLSAVGHMKGGTASSTFFATATVTAEASKTYLTLSIDNSSTALAKSNGSAFTNSVTYSFFARVPIQGWSSNVQMSSDTDTRVVAMQVNGTPTATITGSDSLLKFTTTPTADTHGAFSTSTGLYTVPVSGFYRCTAGLDFNGTFTSDQGTNISIRKNGTAVNQNGWVSVGSSGAGFIAIVSIAATVYCNAGDTLAPGVSSSGSSVVVQSSTLFNYFNVERLSGPSVIAASEAVVAKYRISSNVTSDTASPVNYDTKIFDTHGAVTTGASWKFTAPVTGYYVVCATYYTTSGTTSDFSVYKNGTIQTSLGSVSSSFENNGSTIVQLNAGDYLDLRSGVSRTMDSSSSGLYNQVSIHKI